MKLKLKPLGDKVIIRRLEAEGRTKGGIILPETAKEKPRRGTIVSVGEGKLTDKGARAPMFLKAGDEVIFTSYAGSEVKIDNEEYLIMAESEVLAVIR